MNKNNRTDKTVKLEIQGQSNKPEFRRAMKKIRIPGAVILVIAAGLILLASAGETRRSNFADSFRAIPATLGESTGYPYNENELSLSKAMLIGDKPIIVSANGVKVLSQNADVLQNLHLDWADTKVISVNGRAVVFSNTSNKAYLISRTKQLAIFEEDGTIVTGTVGKNGSTAFSYSTGNAQSLVKVYTPSQDEEFLWECSKEYVSSLALSDSGKKIAISAMGVDNAEIYSRVILFKTKGEAPEFDIKLKGTAVLKMIYTSGGKVIAIGDNQTVMFNSKGEKIDSFEYSSDSLFATDVESDGNTLLCYKEFGGSQIKVVRIPSSGKKNKSFEIGFTPSSVDMRDRNIAFSVDNRIELYTAAGKEKETIECANRVSTCLITETAYYTLENGAICKY